MNPPSPDPNVSYFNAVFPGNSPSMQMNLETWSQMDSDICPDVISDEVMFCVMGVKVIRDEGPIRFTGLS